MENLKFLIDNDEIFSFNGNNLFCSPSNEHVKQMKNSVDDNTTIRHRHSFVSPPSKEDIINVICNFDIEKLEVIDPKYKYLVKKCGTKRYNISQSELNKVWEKIEKQVKINYNKMLQAGRITRTKYRSEIGHEILKQLADYYSGVFTYTRRKL